MPGIGYGVGRGEKKGSFQRTGFHASRILVSSQGCKTAAMQFNHRPLLLDLGEKGVYSSYTLQYRDVTTFGRYVDKLEGKGLIVRQAVVGDRRAYALQITDKGRRELSTGTEIAIEAEKELLGNDPELEDLSRQIASLLNRLEQQDNR